MHNPGHFSSISRLLRRLKSRDRLLKLCSLLWMGLLLFAPPAAGARSAPGPLGERLAAEATWTFTSPPPGGWAKIPSVICATVQDDDGLQEGSALYHYSVDGGSTWSEWSAEGLTYSSPELTTVYLTLTTSALLESPSLNRVEFSIQDWGSTDEFSGPHTVPVDGTPPTVTATPDKTGAWAQPPVTIALQANDALSGVDRTEYRFLMTMTWHPGGTIVIDGSQGDRSYTYEYRAWDRAENVSATQRITVNVDGTPPSCNASVEGPVGEDPSWFTGCVTVTLNASDARSGIAAFHYQIEGQAVVTVPVTVGPTASYSFTLCDACGRKAVSYWASDAAGNVSAPGTVTVRIDRQAPGSPTNATVTPAGWSNSNVFTVCWSNSEECSGVAAAYTKVGSPPISNNDGQLVALPSGASPCLTVTLQQEGQTPLYVWLKDRAGLADYRTAISLPLRYDRTPPYCEPATVQGPLGEDESWYAGCVTVTVTGHDATSGVAALCYQIEDQDVVIVPVTGEPTARHSFPVCYDCGRKIISYWVRDVAGNVQATPGSVTVRIDRQAPTSPISPTVTPSGWSNSNSFAVSWRNPDDCSGVAAAYTKKGSPPAANNDGQLHTLPLGAEPTISGLSVDQEGQTPLYLWLKDRVGHADYRTAVSMTLRYDATPPTTGISVTGTLGRNNYYISPVTVCFNATDATSGVAETRYRLNGGAWQVGRCVVLNTEGTHTLEYYSVDVAGNSESIKTAPSFKLDLYAPTCTLRVDPDYRATESESATVCWSGRDGPGSGVETYTVQYRQGACGQWQAWRSESAGGCATRTGLTANYFHYFRVRAEDRAGHVSEWSSPGQDYVYVEGLVNPSFDTCNWPLWIPASDDVGKLTARVVLSTTHTGGNSCMAQLSKLWWPLDTVPTDAYASFYQSIQLPPLECSRNQSLTLSFWYRIFTYDKAWSKISDNGTPGDPSDDIYGWFDTFEVHILDRDGRELTVEPLLRDGYFGDHVPGTKYDLGWKYYNVDLTRWAGQQVRLEFKVWNRVDKWYPTWVLVDDVKLLPAASHKRLSIPLVFNKRRIGGVQAVVPAQDAGRLVSPTESGHNGADEPPRRY